MPVRATKVVSGLLIDRFFGCGQWDALPSGKDGWAVVSVNCDTETPRSLRPYAEPVKYSPNAIDTGASSQVTIQGTSPIFATNQNGVVILTLQTSDVIATSTKVSVLNGGAAIVGPDDVGIDVVEGNLSLQNLGGLLPLVKINASGAGSGNVITYNGTNIVWAAPAAGYTDEQAQDAVGNNLLNTDTINLVYADAAPSFSANVRLQMSITSDASGIRLSGDAASPGNLKYYGTNGAGAKGFYDIPVASKWADGVSGSIFRNSNVAIGNAPTPTARLTIDAGTEFYPLLTYTNSNVSAWNIFANTDTARIVGLALSEAINGGSLNFQIIRYGSTHATTPNRAEIRNVSNAPLALYTNNAVRLTIAAIGSVTIPNVSGVGDRLLQVDTNGLLVRSAIDPAAIPVYTFENGLTNTAGVVRWGGILTAPTTITQGAHAIRFTGNFIGIHRTTINPTARAVLTVDGLAVVPSTVAGPSEDAIMNLHGTTAGPTQTDTQISIGVNPTATDGAWIQGRSITSYTTPRQIKFQPRGGKEVHGSQSNFDPQFVFAGSGLGATPGTLASVTLHVCNTGESSTRAKISHRTNNTILSGLSHDSEKMTTRLFCIAGAG